MTTHQQTQLGWIRSLLGAEQVQHHRRQLVREFLLERRSGQRRLIRNKQQLQRWFRLRR